MMNIPVDWNVFEYKFSQNPRTAFEKLSTTLFCHEMRLSKGVFRYFNQPYIETQPEISPEGLLTGFQAKYYDASTSLSSKESEFKKVIKNAKIKYPTIQRILIYVNKEMSASTHFGTQKPGYQKNVEQFGEELGITVEWRVPSHIEQMLLEMPIVRDLYFNPMQGSDQWVKHIISRSDSILSSIQSEITYHGKQLKVHRDMQKLSALWVSEKQACVIYGDAGTGKSGAIKDLIKYQKEQDDETVYVVFSSTDLDVSEESLFLHKYGNYQLEDLFSLYGQDKRKVCVIESAEKLSTLNNSQAFSSIVLKFISNGWKVIFTIRTVYKNSFCNILLNDFDYDEFQIERITNEDLETISNQYSFPLPKNTKFRNLLRHLFYLNLYLKLDLSKLNSFSTEEIFFRWFGIKSSATTCTVQIIFLSDGEKWQCI